VKPAKSNRFLAKNAENGLEKKKIGERNHDEQENEKKSSTCKSGSNFSAKLRKNYLNLE
jgi:hypothetical protein